jgi:cytochrome c biogenesis protein CcmG/thiol:disulfide interchange protein DsbE
MRKSLRFLPLLALLALGAGVMEQQTPYLAVGSDAPAFELAAADGNAYSLKAMTAEKPVFVVFWKESCPHNRRAAPFFNALKTAYGDKVALLGIVKAGAAGTRSWVDQFGVTYPLLSDGDGKFVDAYDLTYSICTFQVGTDGKISKVFEGYGAAEMTALNTAMAQAAGVAPAEIDLSGAPQRLTWG